MFHRSSTHAHGLVDLLGKMLSPSDQLIHVVPVGRGHQGKTSVVNVIPRVLDTLQSGNRIGYDSLLKLNEALARVRQTEQDLSRDGLPPTLERSFRTLGLFVDEHEFQRLELSDEIGQPFTDTTPDSSPEALARYRNYMAATAAADVLWLMVSLPPTPLTTSLGLFRDDLARYECWLSETVRKREGQRPVSVAVVVTKIDTLFPSPEAVRAQFTPSWVLDDLLRSLVSVIRKGVKHGCIARAAAIPVSAFGFGNSTALTKEPQSGARYEEYEEEYLLAKSKSLDPFNVLTLLAWSFLASVSRRREKKYQQVARQLETDLSACGDWWLPIS